MLIRLLREPVRLILAFLLALSCAALAGVLMLFAGYNLLIQWLPLWVVLAILALALLAAAGLAWAYFEHLEAQRERRRQAYVHSVVDSVTALLDGLRRFGRRPGKS